MTVAWMDGVRFCASAWWEGHTDRRGLRRMFTDGSRSLALNFWFPAFGSAPARGGRGTRIGADCDGCLRMGRAVWRSISGSRRSVLRQGVVGGAHGSARIATDVYGWVAQSGAQFLVPGARFCASAWWEGHTDRRGLRWMFTDGSRSLALNFWFPALGSAPARGGRGTRIGADCDGCLRMGRAVWHSMPLFVRSTHFGRRYDFGTTLCHSSLSDNYGTQSPLS
ncbi:MAG: hypothetical protein KatS3mg058_1739 [Roseiflexus sp.]|nr:MAG: hypothetical protein KatS3mg058_1739 [Roseiflexus sp.]